MVGLSAAPLARFPKSSLEAPGWTQPERVRPVRVVYVEALVFRVQFQMINTATPRAPPHRKSEPLCLVSRRGPQDEVHAAVEVIEVIQSPTCTYGYVKRMCM